MTAPFTKGWLNEPGTDRISTPMALRWCAMWLREWHPAGSPTHQIAATLDASATRIEAEQKLYAATRLELNRLAVDADIAMNAVTLRDLPTWLVQEEVDNAGL